MSIVAEDLMYSGRLFHKVGPITEKALSPFEVNSVCGRARCIWDADLSVLMAGGADNRSHKYCGARPFNALKTMWDAY